MGKKKQPIIEISVVPEILKARRVNREIHKAKMAGPRSIELALSDWCDDLEELHRALRTATDRSLLDGKKYFVIPDRQVAEFVTDLIESADSKPRKRLLRALAGVCGKPSTGMVERKSEETLIDRLCTACRDEVATLRGIFSTLRVRGNGTDSRLVKGDRIAASYVVDLRKSIRMLRQLLSSTRREASVEGYVSAEYLLKKHGITRNRLSEAVKKRKVRIKRPRREQLGPSEQLIRKVYNLSDALRHCRRSPILE